MDAQSGLSGTETGAGGSDTNIQNVDDLKGNWGPSGFHKPQVFSMNSNYELPIGSNRAVPLKGIADKLLGGWQMSNTARLYSGTVQSPLISVDRVGNIGTAYYLTLRPDLKPGYSNNPVIKDAKWDGAGFLQYTDVSAFTLQPEGYFGNVGRNTIYTPGLIVWNLALVKEMAFGEGKSLQVRGEFFNLTNRVNLNNPSTNIFTNATGIPYARAGQVRDVGEPRKIQLGLKFVF